MRALIDREAKTMSSTKIPRSIPPSMRIWTHTSEKQEHNVVWYIRTGRMMESHGVTVRWPPMLKRDRTMNDPRVERDPDVMSGVPVIAGTRVPVHVIIACLADGMTVDEIVEDMPGITRDQVEAALDWVIEQLSQPLSHAYGDD